VYKDAGGPYVQLDLKPEVSFARGTSNGVPIRAVRSSNNVSNVRNGQTLVIGGIVLNDERNVMQGVPGLSKLPLLGSLFRHKERSRSRNELMVFVTPTIHNEPETITWDRMINLTGTAKEDFGPVSQAAAKPVPTNEPRTESRKE
jgi:type II secretory pathway component GspD/PulD (secretin)